MIPIRRLCSVLVASAVVASSSLAQLHDFSVPPLQPGRAVAELQALPANWFGPGPLHKVWVDDRDAMTQGQLDQSDVVQRHYDYGSFHVYVIDEAAIGGADNLRATGFHVRDEYDLMVFNGLVLDGTQPETLLSDVTRVDPALRLSRANDSSLDISAGLYVVQFEGPVKDEWLAALVSTGVNIVHHTPMNGYVVQADAGVVPALELFGKTANQVQYVGLYEPAYRVHPSLRAQMQLAPTQTFPVTVQFVAHDGVRQELLRIERLLDKPLQARQVGRYINVETELTPQFMMRLAFEPSVFQIEPRGERVLLDEAQGQIVAGEVSGNSPTAPGYLAWLASMGFDSSQFGSFSVNVVDDATSLTGHPDLASGRIDFTANPTNQGGAQGGHGFLNAHIVAGFNSGTGSGAEDSNGYNYGLGIAPWAHVGSTAIFGNTGSSSTSWENSAYGNGARISSNSWGFQSGGNPVADYNAAAQEYDGITRDAQGGVGGNQELLVVFAAGNDGSGGNTVSSPATAKNVLTVGASENVRQTGTDGCAVGNSGANSLNDIIGFSSRGPVNSSGGDGRWKPEMVAPGTHIEAGIPQSNYNGSSVCNQYFPSGQTLYGWSSGTSHSTPAVAGGAALVRQWFLNQGMAAPTPAMNKAALVATTEYMTGVGAGGSLPSNSQGMGLMRLGRAFDGSQRLFVDESVVLASTGATHVLSGNVASGSVPFRVVLVWTDAPGSTSGAPWVNDLDLEVTVGGTTYLGNVFSGSNSATGGSADIRNNTESVFLPAGTSGSFSITVRASSIAGDGVPGNGDGTDQDFALYVYNGNTGGPVLPTADFTGTPVSGNAPLLVNFTDASSPTVTNWAWDFGDGGSSSAQNPTYTYNSTGTYTVVLTVTDPVGQGTRTRTNYINVTSPPVPGISDGSFEGQSAGSTPSAPWTVDFGTGHVVNPSGGTSTDNGLPTDGTQWVEVSGSSTNASTPPSNPGGATNPPSGGAGVSQSFSYSSGTTLFSFDAAFSRNEGANQGTYNDWMSVDITDGSTWQNLYYADTFSATPNTSARSGFPMTAVSNVQVDLATLFPGSSASTNFTVTVLTGNAADNVQASIGFADNFALAGTGPVAPTAEFTGAPTSGTAPLSVNFTDASTGNVTGWSWNFGDGATSTAQNPSHVFSAVGSYTVTLTASGPGGTDQRIRTNYITAAEPAPVAGFSGTPTSGVAPLSVNFTDSSTGAVSGWSWNFGDGTTSTAQNPSHVYGAAGNYDVTLTVTGPGGSDPLVRAGYINVSEPAPVANFSGSPTSGVAPLSVNFADASTGAVTSWSWNFGDGATSSAQNPGHVYASVGTYSVTLDVTGPGGTDQFVRTNYISVSEPAPVAGFSGTPTSGTAPLSVNFSDASTGNVTSWSWNFGDGATSSAQNPSHIYTAIGLFTVTLDVTGPGGTDQLVRTNYISSGGTAPVANFTGTPTTGVAPLSVNFTDSTTGNVTGWSWDFGDGATSTTQNPSHVYAGAGTYTVSLTASGPGGSDQLIRNAYINVSEPAPVAGFSGTPTSGVAPLSVNFTDSSTGAVTSWSWNFGDGASSTAQNPSHVYGAAGNFTVTLDVTGPGGSDQFVRNGYISVSEPAPTASFSGTPTSGTTPLTVNFSDISLGAITSWSWNFGDGSTSTAQNPSHIFTAAGNYTVTLDVTGPGGSDQLVRTNYITVTDPGGSNPLHYMSFTSGTAVPGVGNVADDDIVSYDDSTGTWALYFDGSDVGISGTDIVAMHVRDDGNILMSFNTSNYSLSGLTGGPSGNTVDDSDIVLFTMTSSGANTAGSFSFFFDGSDVGLTTNGEDIHGLHENADGSLVITTVGGVNVGIGKKKDEDLLTFTPSSLGASTAGTWAWTFDGSDVGLATNSGEDIDAVAFDGADLLFSTRGSFVVNGASGNDEDIVRFSGTFGSSTSGTMSLEFALTTLGISSGEDLDGLSLR